MIAQHVVAKSNERIKSAMKQKLLKPSLTFAHSPAEETSLSAAQKEIIIFLREILSRVSYKLMKIINVEVVDTSSDVRMSSTRIISNLTIEQIIKKYSKMFAPPLLQKDSSRGSLNYPNRSPTFK